MRHTARAIKERFNWVCCRKWTRKRKWSLSVRLLLLFQKYTREPRKERGRGSEEELKKLNIKAVGKTCWRDVSWKK